MMRRQRAPGVRTSARRGLRPRRRTGTRCRTLGTLRAASRTGHISRELHPVSRTPSRGNDRPRRTPGVPAHRAPRERAGMSPFGHPIAPPPPRPHRHWPPPRRRQQRQGPRGRRVRSRPAAQRPGGKQYPGMKTFVPVTKVGYDFCHRVKRFPCGRSQDWHGFCGSFFRIWPPCTVLVICPRAKGSCLDHISPPASPASSPLLRLLLLGTLASRALKNPSFPTCAQQD